MSDPVAVFDGVSEDGARIHVRKFGDGTANLSLKWQQWYIVTVLTAPQARMMANVLRALPSEEIMAAQIVEPVKLCRKCGAPVYTDEDCAGQTAAEVQERAQAVPVTSSKEVVDGDRCAS